ncbi:hypothetical protein [Streptoalloteichus tenebrarius]|uniref:hypothetical protein n=1 Tax=Streptoalloteichus tenebrarius (strain ATCC 17920 / DSM 40477 / JCM 4838 / CBS 697.72 / NBRC 16177 / NCIMB 11028 / NRRL B-12390 / A12253. 1 / ISP 5477) TaxID=1933 RepID=UPI0020A360AD|nr:hypothetical protein [Streptoalloteichus tenebrarius]
MIFATTRPTPTPCPRCGRLHLTGLDEGVPYRVDPAPITLSAELHARLAGRRTYALIAGRLALRTPSRIRGDHRGRPPVLPAHQCAHPVTPDQVEVDQVVAVARLLAPKRTAPAPVPTSGLEAVALDLLSEHLGARVMSIDPPPPF